MKVIVQSTHLWQQKIKIQQCSQKDLALRYFVMLMQTFNSIFQWSIAISRSESQTPIDSRI